MENWIQDVILKWKLEGVKLNPPASIDEIENAEAALNFKFPADFKEFYLQVNGFQEWDMLRDSCISLWPLDRMIDESNKWGENDFIGICDWLISCFAIGFHRHKAGFFKLEGKLEDARSVDIRFTELIVAIGRDDSLIYF
nr:SMI1/KNR4 family protein [uncultured Mucilaginibacter sp.]